MAIEARRRAAALSCRNWTRSALRSTRRSRREASSRHAACSACARTLVSDVDAELLCVARNSPALHIQRIAYLTDGSCVEFTKSLYRADAYDFVSELALSPPVRKARR